MTHSVSISTIIIGQGTLLREGIAALLQGSRYKVVATAQTASEIKDAGLVEKRRGIVIIGIDDLKDNIAEIAASIKALRSQFLQSRIGVIAETQSRMDIQQILALNPDCVAVNLQSRAVFIKLLELVMDDQQVILLSRPRSTESDNATKGISPSIIPSSRDNQQVTAPPAATNPKLSQREREVLSLLAVGDSNKEIARLCNITESTVKVHLKAILRKIAAHNRTQAAIWAIANGYEAAPPASPDQSLERRSALAPKSDAQVENSGPNAASPIFQRVRK